MRAGRAGGRAGPGRWVRAGGSGQVGPGRWVRAGEQAGRRCRSGRVGAPGGTMLLVAGARVAGRMPGPPVQGSAGPCGQWSPAPGGGRLPWSRQEPPGGGPGGRALAARRGPVQGWPAEPRAGCPRGTPCRKGGEPGRERRQGGRRDRPGRGPGQRRWPGRPPRQDGRGGRPWGRTALRDPGARADAGGARDRGQAAPCLTR
jgi:hypothetical protein